MEDCKAGGAGSSTSGGSSHTKKQVQFLSSDEGFITEIEDECPITSDEMKNYWYQVSSSSFKSVSLESALYCLCAWVLVL